MNPILSGGLAMAALLLFVVAVATRPFWRRRVADGQARSAANVAAFRLRLAELDQEVAAGLTPAEEAANLRRELELRLLADADESAPPASAAPGARRPLALAAALLFVTAFAAGGYWWSGSWRVQQQIAAAPKPREADPQILAMVDKLAARMREKPADPEGWALLGRSYFTLQRYGDAAQAWHESNARRAAPDAESLTEEAEAAGWAANGELAGPPTALLDAALKLDPALPKALWYGGLAAAQAGELDRARRRWQTLRARDDLPEAMRAALDERLQTLQRMAVEGAAESLAQAGESQPAAAAGPAAPLRLRVTLAPALAAQAPNGAVLFVFARAAQGPQMPLAVQRLEGPKLPLELTLDDSMAMAPALKLSGFDRVVVTARLSASGTAQAASGDLEGRLETGRAKPGDPVLDLAIDRRVP